METIVYIHVLSAIAGGALGYLAARYLKGGN